MKTATKTRKVSTKPGKLQAVYEMDPPYKGCKYILVSSVDHAFATETYIFRSDGTYVTDWMELEGSRRGTWTHKEILKGIGYTIQ